MTLPLITTITIVDEVNCIVGGLLPQHLNMFYDQYGKYSAHYFFDKRYKLGRWAGKLRFFSKTGKTYIFLLDEIVPQLKTLEYTVKVSDKRVGVFSSIPIVNENYFAHIQDPDTGKPIELRYYQVEGLHAILSEGSGILVAATASGKTFINTCLVDCYGKNGHKTLTVVPSSSLVQQTTATFKLCQLDVGEYSGARKDINHTHVVSTWQALNHNPDIMRAFTVVVIDECHQAKAAVLKKLLIDYGTHIVHRFGLTGTMPTDATDTLTIKCAIGPVRYHIKSKELMERSFLSTVDIQVIELQERIAEQYFVNYQDERKYLLLGDKRLRWIANFIHQKANTYVQRSNILCLVSTVEFGRKLTKLIPNAIFVSRDMSREQRLVIFNAFEQEENLVVISTVQLLGLGINISRIFHLVYIDMGRSFIRIIQSIGRGLRMAEDKHNVEIVDICSSLQYSRRHQRARSTYYKQEGFPYKKSKVQYVDEEQQTT